MIVPIGPEGSSLMYGLPLVLYLLFFAHDVPEKQMAGIIRTAAAFFNIDQLPPHFLKDYHRAAMIYTGQILVVLLPKYTNNPISVYNI